MDSTLHQVGIWLCGECFCTHAYSKSCKHADGVVVFAPNFDEIAIHGIPEPSMSGLVVVDGAIDISICTLDRGRSLGIGELGVSSSSFPANTDLLHKVLAGQCRTVKSIPKANRLGFSRCLKAALDKVVASPRDLASWILFLLLPYAPLGFFGHAPITNQGGRVVVRLKVFHGLFGSGESQVVLRLWLKSFSKKVFVGRLL